MPKTRRIKLIGAPTDLGYMNNIVGLAPRIIRDKGLTAMLQAVGLEYADLGDVAQPSTERSEDALGRVRYVEEIREYSERLARTVADSIQSPEDFPVVLGGDHSLSIGSLAGIAAKRPSLGVLWIDAHCDAHTPETTRTGWVYGMPAAIACGLGAEALVSVGGFKPKAAPRHFCIFGAGYYEPEEIENIRRLGIKLITITDILERGLKACLDEALQIFAGAVEHVHVSFDLDAIDEHDAPGTTEPHRGQFTYREITYIMGRIAALENLSSLDVCEYDVSKDVKDTTVKLAIELIARLLGRSFSDYDRYLRQNAVG